MHSAGVPGAVCGKAGDQHPHEHNKMLPCTCTVVAKACAARTRHATVAQAQAVQQRRHAVPAGSGQWGNTCHEQCSLKEKHLVQWPQATHPQEQVLYM